MAIAILNLAPTRRQLQTFGAALGALLAAVGGWLLVRRQFLGVELNDEAARMAVAAAWGLGGLAITVALLRPRWLWGPFVMLSLITSPIGVVISWLILAVVYFGLVTPIGLFRRALGRDSLRLKDHRKRPTYWAPREKARDPRRYFRQY